MFLRKLEMSSLSRSRLMNLLTVVSHLVNSKHADR